MVLLTLGRLVATQRVLQDRCQLEVGKRPCDSSRIRNDIQRREPDFRWIARSSWSIRLSGWILTTIRSDSYIRTLKLERSFSTGALARDRGTSRKNLEPQGAGIMYFLNHQHGESRTSREAEPGRR